MQQDILQMPEREFHQLVIPNKEVLGIYEKRIRSWFKKTVLGDTAWWKEFCGAITTGNAEEVQKLFNEFMADSISISDTCVKKEMKEN